MGHYTIMFGRCPILNKINHEGTKGHEVLFDRIYRMIGIVENGGGFCLTNWVE